MDAVTTTLFCPICRLRDCVTRSQTLCQRGVMVRDLGHCKDHEIYRRVDGIKRPGPL